MRLIYKFPLYVSTIFYTLTTSSYSEEIKLQITNTGDPTLTKSEINVPVYLGDLEKEKILGALSIGCSPIRRSMHMIITLDKSISIFEQNKDGDQIYFSVGKNFPPSLFMRIRHGEQTTASMIGIENDTTEDNSNGINNKALVGVALDIISDNKGFSLFSNTRSGPSKTISILASEDEDKSVAFRRLFRTITDTCKSVLNMR